MSDLAAIVATREFDLRGTHLVAASAGTGKTYSIESLYLRMILQGLMVQQVLVVTFTEAATKELRERLRSVLREAVRRLENPAEGRPSDRIGRLLGLLPDDPQRRAEIRTALRLALLDFDLAAIHTIHGFCLRTLSRFAFETGQSFETTPVTCSTEEVDRLCEDWWRRNLYTATREHAVLVNRSKLALPALKLLARRLVAKPDAVPSPEPISPGDLPARLRDTILPLVVSGATMPEASPPEELQEEGQRVWVAILDDIARARDAAGREAWEEAGSALCHAAGFQWESQPWNLPFDGEAIREVCDAFAKAVKGRSAFSLADGRLVCKGLDLTEPDTALRRALEPLREGIHRIGDLRRFPHKGRNPPHNAYKALAMLETYVHGGATDAKAVVDAIRVVVKSPPGNIPGMQSVTLASVAPAWADVAAALFQSLPGLLTGAALQVRRLHEEARGARDTLSFDDYLINLRAALAGEEGSALRAALRGEYKSALIDEFQDTDPVQYGIFNAIFPSDSDTPCFLVGDPKQAIYRFRNGDIETYLEATRKITDERRRHELRRNYRSEAPMVQAVNELFRDRPASDAAPARRTFLLDEMAYDGLLEANGKPEEESLTVDGACDGRPLKLWHFDGDGSAVRLPGLATSRARTIWRHTANEIRRLLDDATTLIGRRRVRPGDIAVLVMTHGEAAAIEEALAARRIPVVRQGVQPVFRTAEAREFQIVLSAMVDPQDLRRVRAALSTHLLGIPDVDLLAMLAGTARQLPAGWSSIVAPSLSAAGEDEACGLEHWVAFFDALRKAWEDKGLAVSFNDLARRSGLRARLGGLPRGERILTNILHLVEVTHRAEREERLSPGGTLAWLKRLLASVDDRPSEEYELRLETDDDAVTVMTVFKSKGLQFPVVFVPTLWRRNANGRLRGGIREYHDEQGALIVETDERNGSDKAVAEQLREDIRLAYVALTRAVHRTVLVWGGFKAKPGQHALAWLLGEEVRAADLRERFGEASTVEVVERGWDEVAVAPPDASLSGSGCTEPGTLRLPAAPCVEKSYGHASFSSLAPHAADSHGLEADRDEVSATRKPEEELPGAPAPIFAFPAGAKTGTCWHAIFEELPFDAEEPLIRSTATQHLNDFGLMQKIPLRESDRRLEATVTMVSKVLRMPLPPLVDGEDGFPLSAIPTIDRRNEWEFSFRAPPRLANEPRRTSAIAALLRSAWSGNADRAAFLERLRTWDRAIPGGYLTGFVDLLFRRKGRYYILDWKSNRRGGRECDFEAPGLREEMAQHAYFLQYLFYAAAVHQYLRSAVPGYDYARHFGGVYYVFLRGVEGRTSRGVYADRPPKSLVEGLSSILGDFT